MPSKTPGKRTARMTPVTTGTKRRAAIEKRQRAVTLITGGTGFLGSHLVRQLTADGAKDIRVMATSIPDWLVDLGVETFAGSITNADDNKRAVEGISEIYHLAGKVSREREDNRSRFHKWHNRCHGRRRGCSRRNISGSTRHHLALALLRQQGISGDGGPRTFSGQRSASRDYESEFAAWTRRRSSQFHQTHSRLHGAQDRRRADRRRELCRRARCSNKLSH